MPTPDQIDPTTPAEQASPQQVAKPLRAPAAKEGGIESQQAAPDAFVRALRDEMDKRDREQQRQRDLMEKRLLEKLAPAKPADEQPQVSAVESRPAPPAQEQQPVIPQQPQRQPAAPSENPLDVIAASIMEAEGVEIDENDPEAKMVDWTNNATVYKTVAAAVSAKKTRQAQASTPLTGGLPAGSNPIASVTDRDQLWKLANQRR